MTDTSERIVVQGRECNFVSANNYGVSSTRIANGHDVLASDGRWRHWSHQDGTHWITEAAAREFARQHAEPAEAGGREVPDDSGVWVRHGEHWRIRFFGEFVSFHCWPVDVQLAPREGCFRPSDLPHGNWHPAPTADLRAVERLRAFFAEREYESHRNQFFSLSDKDAELAANEVVEIVANWHPARAEAAEAKLAEVERERASVSAAFWKLAAMYESDVEMENQQRPGWATAIIEQARAERDTLAAKLAAAEAEREALRGACEEFRDSVLKGMDYLGNDNINSVLSVFDETIGNVLSNSIPEPPTAAPRQE